MNAELLAVITDLYDAFQAGDRRRFDSHLDRNVTTWESYLPRLASRSELDAQRDARGPATAPSLHSLRVDPLRADAWGDSALVSYLLEVVPQRDAAVETTRVTDVLRREGGEWRIVHHHAEVWDGSAVAEGA